MRPSPSSRQAAAPAPLARPAIPGYHLGELIGESWSVARYRAVRLSRRSEVEMRVLVAPAVDVSGLARRFVDAGQRARSLHHPNLVPCHDVSRDPGVVYQACEEAGPDLAAARRAAGGRLDEKEALRIAVDCARALEALHHDGIVHGDIGPSSVHVAADAPSRLGVPGLPASQIAATPEMRLALYRERGGALPPEAIAGRHEPGVADDVYAVTALLFLMVVGHPACQARSHAELAAFAAAEGSPEPDRLGTKLSPMLVSVLRKGMQRDPAQRYAGAAHLREDLERLLFDFSPIHSRALGEAALPARRRTSMVMEAPPAPPVAVNAVPVLETVELAEPKQPIAQARAPRTAIIAGIGALMLALMAALWAAWSPATRIDARITPVAPAVEPALAPAPPVAAAPRPAAPSAPAGPRWAASSGVDATGRWAIIDVAGHPLRLRHCDRGSLTLGSPGDEVGRHADEGPVVVRITRGFWIAGTETTQAVYQGLVGSNPSSFHGDELPVDSVTWEESRAFCGALSSKTGASVRLPTEAEWEYACRAGNSLPFPDGGAAAVCWSRETAGQSSHPVGSLAANRWGLYDLQGNVMEWCEDAYASYPAAPADDWRGAGGALRSARGGAWCAAASDCRAATRAKYLPGARYFFLGFRIVIDDGG